MDHSGGSVDPCFHDRGSLFLGALSDARLIGLGDRDHSIVEVEAQYLPWGWRSLPVLLLSGAILIIGEPERSLLNPAFWAKIFCSHATKYYHDTPFLLKMLALLLAGINLLVFHRITARTLPELDATQPPLAAKMAGGISLTLWITILTLGRTVEFTL